MVGDAMKGFSLVLLASVVACGYQAATSGDASVVVDTSIPVVPDALVPDAAPPDAAVVDYACAPTATPGHQTISCRRA